MSSIFLSCVYKSLFEILNIIDYDAVVSRFEVAYFNEITMTYKKKLIEVALPLDAINKASAREKSIRHGHPSTLHLWWARRPLAAARAVIFAQMVDDPSAHPDLFPTEKAQEKERQRLFRIIEELVQWENTTNETVLAAGARRDLAELALHLRRERRPSARQRALRPLQAARLP